MLDDYWFKMGRVTELLPSGLGYVRLDGEARTRPFVVGRALRGYNGRPYEDFGLKADTPLFVALESTEVKSLVPEDKRAPVEAVEEMQALLKVAGDPGKDTASGIHEPFNRFLRRFMILHRAKENAAEPQPDQIPAEPQPGQISDGVKTVAEQKSW